MAYSRIAYVFHRKASELLRTGRRNCDICIRWAGKSGKRLNVSNSAWGREKASYLVLGITISEASVMAKRWCQRAIACTRFGTRRHWCGLTEFGDIFSELCRTLDNFMSRSSSLAALKITIAPCLRRRSDQPPFQIFGRQVNCHPQPFVNPIVFASFEIHSQSQWYADCTIC